VKCNTRLLIYDFADLKRPEIDQIIVALGLIDPPLKPANAEAEANSTDNVVSAAFI
jgi:hypothetical protein